MRQTMAQPDQGQGMTGALEGVMNPGELQRNSDIFQRRHRWDQVESLEHDPHMISAEASQTIFVERREVLAGDGRHVPGSAFQSGMIIISVDYRNRKDQRC